MCMGQLLEHASEISLSREGGSAALHTVILARSLKKGNSYWRLCS